MPPQASRRMAEHEPGTGTAYLHRLHRTLALYVVGVLGFLALMA